VPRRPRRADGVDGRGRAKVGEGRGFAQECVALTALTAAKAPRPAKAGPRGLTWTGYRNAMPTATKAKPTIGRVHFSALRVMGSVPPGTRVRPGQEI
jgi:hypothetical protein